MEQPEAPIFDGCTIPPYVYDIAFAWDPRPEVQRLLFLARECGVTPCTALELGCGTARLFPPLSENVPSLVGIELNPAMAALARARTSALNAQSPHTQCQIAVGDMSRFALGRQFDLIYSSANTIRHLLTEPAIRGLFRCVADHLAPSGVFIVDLELGIAAESDKVGKPATWFMARDGVLVHVKWCVTRPPDPVTRICGIEWTFEVRDGAPPAVMRQSFDLRTYDADEFIRLATEDARLLSRDVFEIREPYLFPAQVAQPEGRHLAVFQRSP